MGSLYRSKAMQLVQLFMQLDAAHDTLDELGKIGAIQFRDVCPSPPSPSTIEILNDEASLLTHTLSHPLTLDPNPTTTTHKKKKKKKS